MISVDYQLAPEHPYPAAVRDAICVCRGLLDAGVPAQHVAFAGESAGGGLVIAGRDAGLPQPSGAVVFSPWVDLTLTGASMTTKAAVDPSVTPDGLRRRVSDYVGAGRRSDQPPVRRPARPRAAAHPGRIARGAA